jgi:hypothetical protein
MSEIDRKSIESLEAERTLLGTFLIRPSALRLKETEGLTPDDFSSRAHQTIYRAMLSVSAESDGALEIILPQILRERKELSTIGGIEYISDLIDSAVDHLTLEPYVKLLKDKSIRRSIVLASETAIGRAGSLCGVSEVIDSAIVALEALREQSAAPLEDILSPWSKFRNHGLENIDWLVDGVIEVGTNGFILGPPKSRKSWAAEALAVSLVSGEPWFGRQVRTRRTALVSREDHAGTTARRVKQLFRGKDIDPDAPWIDDVLWLNSRAEARVFLLTDSSALRTLIANLKARQVEFLILDVLGVLHEGDENEVKEMRAVLRCVERLVGEVGCQACIVHHARKGCEWGDTLSNWARGSSVIAGFAEFLMGCMVADQEQGIIHTKFDSKADRSIDPFYWQIQNFPERKALELNRVDYTPKKNRGRENLF